MKLCNDTITIFNARVDPDTGGNEWTPTEISGVSFYATDASTVDTSKGGLVAANKATIRIPTDATFGGTYTDPISYKSAASVTGLWTIQQGDVIIKGIIPTPEEPAEPTEETPEEPADEPAEEPEEEPEEEAEEEPEVEPEVESEEEPEVEPEDTGWTPAKLKRAYPDCVTVLAVTDNRRAPNAPHWKVTAT